MFGELAGSSEEATGLAGFSPKVEPSGLLGAGSPVKRQEFDEKILKEMEEELKKTDTKVGGGGGGARINLNIHNEVVDELEETRNMESV